MKVLEKPKDFDDITFSQKAHQVYNKIKNDLVVKYKGKIIAIEPESGDYFIADTTLQASDKARARYPGKFFYFFRIGYKGVYKRR